MRSRALALTLLAGLVLGACGSSAKKSASSTTTKSTAQQTDAAATGTLVVTLAAPNHTPKVKRNWPITVTAQDVSGRSVRAHVQYLFLFNGAVVAKRSNFVFTGVFHDNIIWPESSVGLPVTFRALVTSPIGTKALDYPVRVSH